MCRIAIKTVRFSGALSETFVVRGSGLGRDDALSPLLFDVVLDEMARNGCNRITVPVFANDITLLEEYDVEGSAKSRLRSFGIRGY